MIAFVHDHPEEGVRDLGVIQGLGRGRVHGADGEHPLFQRRDHAPQSDIIGDDLPHAVDDRLLEADDTHVEVARPMTAHVTRIKSPMTRNASAVVNDQLKEVAVKTTTSR